MATVAWWDQVDPRVQQWLIDNNGDSIPAEVASHILAGGGEVTVGEPLPDDVVDWIEAVANGESLE
jgi:hypothetical protein